MNAANSILTVAISHPLKGNVFIENILYAINLIIFYF